MKLIKNVSIVNTTKLHIGKNQNFQMLILYSKELSLLPLNKEGAADGYEQRDRDMQRALAIFTKGPRNHFS